MFPHSCFFYFHWTVSWFPNQTKRHVVTPSPNKKSSINTCQIPRRVLCSSYASFPWKSTRHSFGPSITVSEHQGIQILIQIFFSRAFFAVFPTPMVLVLGRCDGKWSIRKGQIPRFLEISLNIHDLEKLFKIKLLIWMTICILWHIRTGLRRGKCEGKRPVSKSKRKRKYTTLWSLTTIIGVVPHR